MGWDTPQVQRGPMLYQAQTPVVAAGAVITVGQWDVRSFAGIFLAAYGAVNGANLVISASPDPSFQKAVTLAQYVLRAEVELHVVLPVLADYVQAVLEIPAGSGLPNFQGNLWVQAVNNIGSPMYPGPNQGIFQTSVSTTPGYHGEFWLPYVQPGPAQLFFSSTAGSDYWVELRASDLGANFNTAGTVAAFIGPSGQINEEIILPPAPCWLDIQDKTASGSNAYSFGLYPGGPQ